MLHATIRSKDTTIDEQMVEVISCANREYFFHGKDVFNTRHKQLRQILVDHGLLFMADTFRTWEQLSEELSPSDKSEK